MWLVIFRFLIGGIVVAGLPFVAARVGSTAAGLLMVVPAITLVGLSFIWSESGRTLAGDTALAGMWGLLAVLSFLGAFTLTARTEIPAVVVFVVSVTAWLAAASVLLWVRHLTE
jgi:uncharacterized membrane protein (GlpM family)